MIATPKSSFVLFPLGNKRFALPAETVNEMACPDEVQNFPHTTPLLVGVLVRRGRIVPVCDLAQVLVGNGPRPRRFCLIATLKFDLTAECVAVPVTGDCELISAELLPPTVRLPNYVTGLLPVQRELVQVLDVGRLIATEVRA